MFDGFVKSLISCFCHSGEGRNLNIFNRSWMPDQARHDVSATLYESIMFAAAIKIYGEKNKNYYILKSLLRSN